MGTDLIVPIELTDSSLKANHRMQVRISLRFIFKKSRVLLLPDQGSGEKKFPLLECQYILYRYLFFIKISALFLYICRVFFFKRYYVLSSTRTSHRLKFSGSFKVIRTVYFLIGKELNSRGGGDPWKGIYNRREKKGGKTREKEHLR